MPRHKTKTIERVSLKITDWVGTPQSIMVHSAMFIGAFALILLGIDANTVMLVVTTAVSLEAIYLALFIQMTVNRQAKAIKSVEKDIDAIQEDVEVIEEIQEDLTQLQAEEQREEKNTDADFAATQRTLLQISQSLNHLSDQMIKLQRDLAEIKTSETKPLTYTLN